MEQAVAAMNDLTRLALAEGEPLWQRRGDMEILNGLQYLRDFTGIDSMLLDEVMRLIEISEQNGSASFELPSSSTGPTFEFNPLHIECSRAIGFVGMAPMTIIELLMDLVINFFSLDFECEIYKVFLYSVHVEGILIKYVIVVLGLII